MNDAINDFDATYSAEDNKLRIYAAYRLDKETYQRAKKLGFRWAPKQELFVAPAWTPEREDFCIELAGEIEAEESTLAERAEAKAERLAGYSMSRANDANAYYNRSRQLSERFAYGQPILIGHYSERSARSDQRKADNAMRNAQDNYEKSQYWIYKSASVIRHANSKNSDRTRINRIERLAKGLRDVQRTINSLYLVKEFWTDILQLDQETKLSKLDFWSGSYMHNIKAVHIPGDESLREMLASNPDSANDIINYTIETLDTSLNSDYRKRWINHYLNRLGYERDMLGVVSVFDGELKPSIIQTFLRYHGADKPKAKKSERGYMVECKAPLPLHIGDGISLDLSDKEWRELMQSFGYEVPSQLAGTAPKKPPLLNLDIKSFVRRNPYHLNVLHKYDVVTMTKDEYSNLYQNLKCVYLSACGGFRMKTALIEQPNQPFHKSKRCCVFITDSKQHQVPDSYHRIMEEYAAIEKKDRDSENKKEVATQ